MANSAENQEILGEIWKNTRGESVKVSKVEYRGSTYYDIRKYFTAEDRQEHPTQKGIRIDEQSMANLINLIAGGVEIKEDEGSGDD